MRRTLSIAAVAMVASTMASSLDAAGTPDPSLLPAATTSQTPRTTAYDALNVPALPAGGSYLDPLTGARVYKITSSAFPAAGSSWLHDYAEGGNEVSLPLDAAGTRVIHVLTASGAQWLIDFTPGVGVSNPRNLGASAFRPYTSLCVTFSNNPATPYYMYVSLGTTIRRIDVRTMTEVPGGGWPVTGETEAMWLHQNEDDSFFTWMRGSTGSTIVGYEPATGTKKTYTNSALNEPRIDRDASNRSVCISMSSPQNQALFWDWRRNVIAWSSPFQSYGGEPPVAHQASMRGYWIGTHWTLSHPWPFYQISATPNSVVSPLPGGAAQGGGHCNGNWNQRPADPNDQWFACYYYGSLAPPSNYGALAPGGILLANSNGQRRVLAHLYNTAPDYTYHSFAKLAPDGAYVLFTSNMNGSARSDLFLAELPTSGSPQPGDTTAPTVAITAPAGGATLSGTVNLTATASDDVGVTGVQFHIDGTPLGSEVTAAPFTRSWNTATATNGVHSVTAVARDAAGNRTTSASVSVTVLNSSPNGGNIVLLHLDEGAGVSVFNDSSGAANHGSCAGTGCPASGSPGKSQNGAAFDGNDLITIAHKSALNAFPLTVSAWFRSSSTSGVAGLVNKYVANSYSGYNVFLNNGNLCAWYMRDTSSYAYDNSGCTFNIAGFNDNLWHQVAYVVDTAGGRLYVDGVQRGATVPWTGTAGAPTSTQDVHVGHYPGAFGGVEYFAGSLDEIRIYDVAMSAAQIGALYDSENSDSTPPAVAITSPLAGASLNGTVNITAAATDNVGVAGVQFYVDGTALGAEVTAAPFTRSWNTTTAGNGAHSITAVARDAAGNRTTSAAVAVTVANVVPDTTAPSVAITAPTGAATLSGTVNLTANASDNAGVAGVQFHVDGTPLGAEVTAAPFTRAWNTTTASNGSHSITAVARDAAGNRTTSAAVTVTVINSSANGGNIVLLHLDEGAGASVFTDSSGALNHGACAATGCPASGTGGKVQNGAVFDGANDLITIPHKTSLNAFPLTVSAWFKSGSTSGVAGLVNKYVADSYDGYNVFLNNGNLCAWYMRSGSDYVYDGSGCTFNVAGFNDNAWHQLTYVVDTTGGKLYVDGIQKGGTLPWTGAAGTPTTAQDVHVGHYPGAFGGAEFFAGSLDEIRIYDRALSAAEVSALYADDNPPVDSTSPTVAITSPSAGATLSGTINITATAADNVGVAGVQFYVDGTASGAEVTAAPFTRAWNTTSATNGGHSITAVARDAAGNRTTSAAVAVTVMNSSANGGNIVLLHLDEGAGASVFTDSSGASNHGSCTGPGCPTSGTAGKVRNGATFDGTNDVITIPHQTSLNAFPLTVSAWFKSSSTSGVVGLVNKYVADSYNGYNVFLNNGNICAWYIRSGSNYAYDGSGCTFNVAGYNDNTWHQVTYVVDPAGGRLYVDGVQRGSTLPWTGTSGPATNSQNIHVGHYPGAFGGVEFFTGSLDEIRIYDRALTAAEVGALYAGDNPPSPPVDSTSPTVAITSPLPGTSLNGTINITATAADDLGVAGVQLYVDAAALGAEITAPPFTRPWNTTAVSNGAHSITAVARDAAGNRTTSAPVTVNVSNVLPDTTAPAVSITSPANGASVTGMVTITAVATDNVGIAGVRFYVDGSPVGSELASSPFATSWDTSTASLGSRSITAIARDAAGNSSTSTPVNVTVERLSDTTPPTVPSGLAATALSSSQISLTWAPSTDAQSGVAGYRIYRNGLEIATTGATSFVDSGLTASSTFTYTVVAYDFAGLSSTHSQSASATTHAATVPPGPSDTTPPSIKITAPEYGAVVAGAVTVGATTSDNVGVTGVQFFLNGAPLGDEVQTTPFVTTWNAAAAPSGSHTLTAVARDAAGNRATSAAVVVQIINGEGPFHASPIQFPGRMQAEDFDRGGEGATYHDTTPGNSGGFYRLAEDVDIVNPYANGYAVSDIQAGEWLKYTIVVDRSGTYRISALVSSNRATGRFRIRIDGNDVTGSLEVPDTGGLRRFKWTGPSAIQLTAGQHVMTLVVEQGEFNVDAFSADLEAGQPGGKRRAGR